MVRLAGLPPFPRRGAAALLCAAATLPACATSAHAAPAVQLDTVGTNPDAVVEPNGTADIVWSNPTTRAVTVCILPRGAAACATRTTLTMPPTLDTPEPKITRNPADGSLWVTVQLQNGSSYSTFAWSATSFAGPWSAASLLRNAQVEQYAAEPVFSAVPGTFIMASADPNLRVQSVSTDGTGSATTSHANLGAFPYDPGLARLPDGSVLLAGSSINTTNIWRLGPVGNADSAPSWGSPKASVAIDPGAFGGRFAGNGTDAYLFSPADTGNLDVRRYDPATDTFLPPTTVDSANGIQSADVAVADPVGAAPGIVGAAWRNLGSLLFSRSSDGGSTFTRRTIATGELAQSALNLDLALAPDGDGVAVWERDGIVVTSTAAVPSPATPTPSPTPTPTPKGGAGSTGSGAGSDGNGPDLGTTTSQSFAGGTITFSSPAACVKAGAAFVVDVGWTTKQAKGLKQPIKRVDFYVGTRRFVIDRKAPFRQTIVIAKARAGATYKIRAVARLQSKSGKRSTKQLRTSVTVCS